ncbi:type VII secretion protein EccB [Streptomyces sp. NPDC000594]|uniref:type VII secretion protein EccB n=1 Tax=Streptomyces sp. NPDC000594 TaxID=3154261 RepID=UPI0033272950
MQTRRDQVQAHLFTLSRVQAGLVRGEPDAPEVPMRRFSFGTVAGGVAAVVALAGFAAFGFVSPGSGKGFQKEGTLVVVKDNGARYLYLSGALHPVVNRSSALLITGGSALKPRTVTVKAIREVPRGPAVGIVGAPEGLPPARGLDRGGWTVCSGTADDGRGRRVPQVSVYVGERPEGLRILGPGEALRVSTGPGRGGTQHLAWTGRRYEVSGPNALTALGLSHVPPLTVGDAWLNTLTEGPGLEQDDVPGRGGAGVAIGGLATRIGQVVRDEVNDRHFLVWAEGITPLTATEAALVLGDPRTAPAYPAGDPVAVPVSPGAVAQTAITNRPLNRAGLPPVPPVPVADPGTGLVPCVAVEPGRGPQAPASVRLAVRTGPAGRDPEPAGLARPGSPAADGGALADRVVVPAGRGVLAQEESTAGDTSPTLFLVTDAGVKYPLATPEVAGTLGYGGVAPVPVPGRILSLVPTGPVLDPTSARRPLAADPGVAPPPAPPDQPDPAPGTNT